MEWTVCLRTIHKLYDECCVFTTCTSLWTKKFVKLCTTCCTPYFRDLTFINNWRWKVSIIDNQIFHARRHFQIQRTRPCITLQILALLYSRTKPRTLHLLVAICIKKDTTPPTNVCGCGILNMVPIAPRHWIWVTGFGHHPLLSSIWVE